MVLGFRVLNFLTCISVVVLEFGAKMVNISDLLKNYFVNVVCQYYNFLRDSPRYEISVFCQDLIYEK